jgi:hypothetical protein
MTVAVHQYFTELGRFVLVPSESPVDDYRGGVSAEILNSSGGRVARLQVFCHPDFPGFETCAALSADEMLAIAALRLQDTGHDAIVLAASSGASAGLFINTPDWSRPAPRAAHPGE